MTNSAAYDAALRQYGSLTVWFTDAAIAAWKTGDANQDFTGRSRVELTKMRVLVVEDEVMISILMEEFLLDLGCDVAGTALSLDEVLEKAGTLAIDVGLLDEPRRQGELSRGQAVTCATHPFCVALPHLNCS